jgi:hypothetical protein
VPLCGGTRIRAARFDGKEGDFLMTRLFLAAGVAALALAAPASAKPGGGGGHHGNQASTAHGGGNHRAQVRGGGGQRAHAQRPKAQARSSARGGGHARVRTAQRNEKAQKSRSQRVAAVKRGNAQHQAQARRQHDTKVRVAGRHERQVKVRDQRIERRQARNDRRDVRVVDARNRQALRNEVRDNRFARIDRADLRHNVVRARQFDVKGRHFALGCPPGLASKGCMPPGQARKLLGRPLSLASKAAALSALPLSARALYPDTNDYYYRYGDGYLYRVDRDSSLIDSLLPLAFGGYVPGSYFPSSYMGSYNVPNYYGFNNFYPDSPYSCNRYANGVIYRVDCASGFVEDVVPLYAGGYGVGQLLPSGYGYYNVPNQYRSMYYNTSGSGYWYAPGAIYQYDPSSSMITSVAALLSPGFSIGQPLPLGYNAYNVPYAYRTSYYDTPNDWYRYNNGYIYRVDPTTQLVTAIVASILT